MKKNVDLSKAASKGQLDEVKQLIKAGADIDTRCNNDHAMTPLMLAAYYNRTEVVRELLKHGANTEVSTPFLRCTPLMLASKNGHLEVVKELLVAGADYRRTDRGGKTALELAKKQSVADAILDFQNSPGDKSVVGLDTNTSILEVSGDATSVMEKNCVVCLKPRRQKSFLLNCGHITACYNCAQDIFRNRFWKKCPTCNQPIQEVHKAYDC